MILEPIYLYCERSGPGLWAEPLNLAASFSFLLSALLIWRMSRGVAMLRWLGLLTFLMFLAICSTHIVPLRLTLGLTLITVLMFASLFFYAVNHDFVGLSRAMSVVASLLMFPFMAICLPLLGLLPGQFGSLAFLPLGILMLGYPTILRADHPKTAQGILVGALILGGALVARSADLPLCEVWPYGTHFVWKLGSGLLTWHLAWVYRCHMLAGGGGGR